MTAGKTRIWTQVTERRTRIKCEVQLDRTAIIELLRDHGVPLPEAASEIAITFHVPGGGDYANEDVDLDDSPSGDQVVTVAWMSETEFDSRDVCQECGAAAVCTDDKATARVMVCTKNASHRWMEPL